MLRVPFSTTIRSLKKIAALLSVAVLAISGATISGCSNTQTADTGLEVTSLTVTPPAVTSGETTVIEGVVSNGGTPTINRVVTFSVTPSTAGYFTPTVDTSDANGLVASIFTGTSVGSATISASVSGGSARTASVVVNGTSQVGSGNIDIDLSNSLLLANGTSTSSVTITVRDDQGGFAPDNTIVRIVAGEKFVDLDGNGYWSNGVDSLVFDGNGNGTWDAIGFIVSSGTIVGGAGQVVVTYTAGTVASTVYIKASVDDGSFMGESEVSLQLTPNAAVNSIFLDVDRIHLAVKQTGGYETGQISAWCYDVNGNPVPEGVSVSFIITDGPGGGENIGALGYGPYVTTTNSQGVARSPISSGTAAGTVRLRAFADTVLSDPTLVIIDAGPPAEISVGVDTCNERFWRTVADEMGVTAVVRDIYHNPVADSTAVYFTTEEGQVMAHQSATTEHRGVAYSTWLSGYDKTGHDGRVWIYAETAGGTVRDSVMFFNSDYLDTIVLSGFPSTLVVDGEDKQEFTLLLFDLNGNPTINGLSVDHSERFLAIEVEASENECSYSYANSNARRVLPLSRDYVMSGATDDGIGAIDTVAFYLENAYTIGICSLLTGQSYGRNSNIIDLSSSIDSGQTIPFNIEIKDRFGNPLGSHSVTASASAGTILTGTQTTNLYGEAYGFQFLADMGSGVSKVTISVVDNDPRGNGMVITTTISINY